ncbi:hypothetical protein [Streptomyces carpinensis]|uniref:Secreted protein n=1 Tax=Streptomyces carpinensis TaxID=66369 RepID=A0ABV1VW57_9ACTN|nr:hypothetical protein [Streptomyces carpinensis]
MSVRRSAKHLTSPFLGVLQTCSVPGCVAVVAARETVAAAPVEAVAAGKPTTMAATAAAVKAARRAEVFRAPGLMCLEVRIV